MQIGCQRKFVDPHGRTNWRNASSLSSGRQHASGRTVPVEAGKQTELNHAETDEVSVEHDVL